MNKMYKVRKNAGIALFQVLLISTILAILAIQFTQTARNQVAIANTISDRVKAQLTLKTTESELLFTLLTKNKAPANDNNITKLWNFYGQPFIVSDQIAIEIQDQNGLLGVYNLGNGRLLEKLITNLAPNLNASMIANSLIDWQDIDSLKRINGAEQGDYNNQSFPTNLPLQNYHELLHVQGMNQDIWQRLANLLTIRPLAYFNPYNAPKDILLLTLEQTKVEKIIQLRENNQLTKQAFSGITLMEEDDFVIFSTGNLLKVQIHITLNDVVLSKSLELYLQPYNKAPLIEYAIRN